MKRITTLLLLIAFTLTVYGQEFWSGVYGGWYHEKQMFTINMGATSFVVDDITYIIAYPEVKTEEFYYPDNREVWVMMNKNGEWVKATDKPIRVDNNTLRTYLNSSDPTRPFHDGVEMKTYESRKVGYNNRGGIQVTFIIFGKKGPRYYFDHYETYVFAPKKDGMLDFKKAHTPDIKMRVIEND